MKRYVFYVNVNNMSKEGSEKHLNWFRTNVLEQANLADDENIIFVPSEYTQLVKLTD